MKNADPKASVFEWIRSAKGHLTLAAEQITEDDDGALRHLDEAITDLHRVYFLIGLERGANFVMSHQAPEAKGDN